jgi:hypothetical protein
VTFTDNEPAITAGTITALAAAIMAAFVAFGLPWTPEQRDAVNHIVTIAAPVIAPLLAASLIRGHVTPTKKVDEKVEDQVAQALSNAVSAPPPVAPAS